MGERPRDNEAVAAVYSMSKRRRLLLVVLGLVLALVAVVAVALGRVPRDDVSILDPGSLRIGAGVAGALNTGDLTVSVEDGDAPRVVIATDDDTVWSSEPGHAFLGAGRGEVAAEEHRGYFWMSTEHETTWTTQTIDRAELEGDAIALGGRLLDDDDEPGPRWSARVAETGTGAVLDAQLDETGGATSLTLWSAREERAAVHGFGEQFTDVDLDDRLLPIIVREQGVGRGEQPLTVLADVTNHGAGGTERMTYAAWPSWVTEDLRGVRLDPELGASHALGVADTRSAGRVGLEMWATTLRAELTAAATPRELIERQQAGRERPELAAWTGEGAVIGIQGGTETVRRTVRELQDAGTEIAGVWLQDWTGQRTTSFGERLWWTWQPDRERYPGWEELVAELNAEGIAVTTYVNAFLVHGSSKEPAPERDLWAEADELGYLVQNAEGDPYALDQGGFDAYLVDLTDSAARDWYAEVIASEVLGDGVSGFMADFGEGLPLDAVLSEGDAAVAHNRWPALWAETVREACELAEQPDCVTWFRSGAGGMDESTPMFWNGDQLVSFGEEDGLGSVLRGTFSAGFSGWPLVHSDVGGYTSIDAVVKDYTRTPELLARWAEMEAFGVMMRTHEGNRPEDNVQVVDTAETRSRFAHMTRVFAALAPYRREVVEEALATGVPAIRHGWLVAPGTVAADVDTQFFLGPSVLVAPVTTEGEENVEVTFPPGTWRHLLTGDEYAGDTTREVAAPVGTPAAFVETSDPWADRLDLSSVR
ncbi:alpha-glucosidase [Aeromicrobium piscarium]|uniref:Alpha-glucosidase n=1 Tax=Aeromicrobium piscarium TaxID=2590901 RepID=A0A554S730_9ACTN|nr:alpha-glucosidase [Aeromicrobium piscarium]TSD62105.1 alpha-glucosidase [Aeromicrobium piscarium]